MFDSNMKLKLMEDEASVTKCIFPCRTVSAQVLHNTLNYNMTNQSVCVRGTVAVHDLHVSCFLHLMWFRCHLVPLLYICCPPKPTRPEINTRDTQTHTQIKIQMDTHTDMPYSLCHSSKSRHVLFQTTVSHLWLHAKNNNLWSFVVFCFSCISPCIFLPSLYPFNFYFSWHVLSNAAVDFWTNVLEKEVIGIPLMGNI